MNSRSFLRFVTAGKVKLMNHFYEKISKAGMREAVITGVKDALY